MWPSSRDTPSQPSRYVTDTAMSFTLFTRLGSYQVTAKIGEGSMGEVYRVRDTKLDRDVAIKVLSQVLTDDPDRLVWFEPEVEEQASQLRISVCKVLDSLAKRKSRVRRRVFL